MDDLWLIVRSEKDLRNNSESYDIFPRISEDILRITRHPLSFGTRQHTNTTNHGDTQKARRSHMPSKYDMDSAEK
jgi:hypothetical protein